MKRIALGVGDAIAEVRDLSRRTRSSTADKFVSESVQLRATIGRIVEPAQRREYAKLSVLGERADALNKETNALALRLGAPACAQG